jgi:hypothetical protein
MQGFGDIWFNKYVLLIKVTFTDVPITVAARSKAWTVFTLSNAGILSSNPTQSMDVYIIFQYPVALWYHFYIVSIPSVMQ